MRTPMARESPREKRSCLVCSEILGSRATPFSGNPTNDTSGLPRSGARMDKNDPYYTYIANNILLGVWE